MGDHTRIACHCGCLRRHAEVKRRHGDRLEVFAGIDPRWGKDGVDLFERAPHHVAVETTGTHTRGMTVIDQRTLRDRPPANCDVLTRVDAARAWDVVIDAIASFAT